MHKTIIRDIRAAMRDAWTTHAEHRTNPAADTTGKLQQWRADRAATKRATDANARAIAAFAELNGWRQAKSFSIARLGKARGDFDYPRPDWIDHPLYFKAPWLAADGRRQWANAALVAQPYGLTGLARDDIERLVREGFLVHVPPQPYASFWNPGSTVFLAVTSPGVTVQWLPEQLEPHPELEPSEHWQAQSTRDLAHIAGLREFRTVSAKSVGLDGGGVCLQKELRK